VKERGQGRITTIAIVGAMVNLIDIVETLEIMDLPWVEEKSLDTIRAGQEDMATDLI
jgi:hypothetical protein